jgi:hypothetical protein
MRTGHGTHVAGSGVKRQRARHSRSSLCCRDAPRPPTTRLPMQRRASSAHHASPAIGDKRVSEQRPDACFHGRMFDGRAPASRRRHPPRAARPHSRCRLDPSVCGLNSARLLLFSGPIGPGYRKGDEALGSWARDPARRRYPLRPGIVSRRVGCGDHPALRPCGRTPCRALAPAGFCGSWRRSVSRTT